MKTLEELGISHTPWKNPNWKNNSFVFDGNNLEVAIVSGDCKAEANANATLISAAPELYEELRQEMERRYCVECKHSVWTKRGGIEIMTGCDGKGVCPKPSWKKVLDKASGKE